MFAVDPLALAAADLDGRELVEPNPEPLRRAPAVQNKLVLAELEPAAGDRVLTGAPDDGVVGRVLVGTVGGHGCCSRSAPYLGHRSP